MSQVFWDSLYDIVVYLLAVIHTVSVIIHIFCLKNYKMITKRNYNCLKFSGFLHLHPKPWGDAGWIQDLPGTRTEEEVLLTKASGWSSRIPLQTSSRKRSSKTSSSSSSGLSRSNLQEQEHLRAPGGEAPVCQGAHGEPGLEGGGQEHGQGLQVGIISNIRI